MADKEILIEIKVDDKAAQKAVTSLTSAIESNKTATQKLEAENKKLAKSGKQNTKLYKENAELIALNKNELSTLTRERKRAINTSQAEKGTLTALRNERAKLTEQRNRDLAVGSKEFDEQNKRIKGLTQEIKAGEEAGDNFTSSVGKYQNALQGAGASISQINPAMGGMISNIQGMTKAALRFIATPLGAILAAIVLALKAVSLFFTRTEEGGDSLAVGMAFLSGVLEGLLDILSAVGKLLFESFINTFKKASAQFDVFSATLQSGLLELDLAYQKLVGTQKDVDRVNKLIAENSKVLAKAEKDLADVVAEANKDWEENTTAINEASKSVIEKGNETQRLQVIENDLRRTVRANTVEEAKRRQEIQKNLLVTRDFTESFKDRKKALEEATATELEQLAAQEKIAQIEFDLAKKRDAINDSDSDALDEVAEAEANLINVRTASFKRQRELVNRRTEQLNRENAEQKRIAKEREDRRKKEEADELAAFNRQKDATLSLEQFRRTQAINEQTDRDLKFQLELADEDEKLRTLLANEQLIETEREILIEASEQRKLDIKKKFSDETIKLTETEDKAKEDAFKKESARLKQEDSLRRKLINGYLSVLSSVFRTAGQLAGENFELQKAFAIAEATINTGRGITQAIASSPPPLSFVQAAAVGAAGAVQIANIAKTQPKTSGGGAISVPLSGGGNSQAVTNTSAADDALREREALESAIKKIGLSVSVTEINEAQVAVTEANDNSSI